VGGLRWCFLERHRVVELAPLGMEVPCVPVDVGRGAVRGFFFLSLTIDERIILCLV